MAVFLSEHFFQTQDLLSEIQEASREQEDIFEMLFPVAEFWGEGKLKIHEVTIKPLWSCGFND